jgi:hypothetical protein
MIFKIRTAEREKRVGKKTDKKFKVDDRKRILPVTRRWYK